MAEEAAKTSTNGAGQEALAQQGEVMRALGQLEGQLSQLQQSVSGLEQKLDTEHDEVRGRVGHLEMRMRKSDGRMIAVGCLIVAVTGAGASGEHLIQLLASFL